MQSIKFSKVREELSSVLDMVSRDRVPVEITRRDKASAVIIDKDEYEGLMETVYLLSSPKNAKRLLAAVADVEAGRNLVNRDLVD